MSRVGIEDEYFLRDINYKLATIGSEINKKTYIRTSDNATIIDGVLLLTFKNCRDSGVGRQGSEKLFRSS